MTPIAQAKNVFDKVSKEINDYLVELLNSNGNVISVRKEVLMQTNRQDDNDPSETYLPSYVEEIRNENGEINIYQSKNGRSINFCSQLNLIEKEMLVMEAAKAAENEAAIEFFPITSVAREDVRVAGFNPKKVNNEDMEKLATKMSDAYVGNGFWEDLKIIAEHLDFPKGNRYVMGWSQADDANMVVYANSLEEAQEIFENGDYELEENDEDAWLDHAHEVLDERFPDADEGVKDDFACEHWQNTLSDTENCKAFKEYKENNEYSPF